MFDFYSMQQCPFRDNPGATANPYTGAGNPAGGSNFIPGAGFMAANPSFAGMPGNSYIAGTPHMAGNAYIPWNQYNAGMTENPGVFYNQPANQYKPDNNLWNPAPRIPLKDYGPEPFALDIEEAAKLNNAFRLALWTGKHLQVTLMSLNVGEDIGLEVHNNLDQFIRIEEGQGVIRMGDTKDNLDFQAIVWDDYAIMIPAGKWHNLYNTGNRPLKLYSIYAPVQHPHGTVHKTKENAEAAEH